MAAIKEKYLIKATTLKELLNREKYLMEAKEYLKKYLNPAEWGAVPYPLSTDSPSAGLKNSIIEMSASNGEEPIENGNDSNTINQKDQKDGFKQVRMMFSAKEVEQYAKFYCSLLFSLIVFSNIWTYCRVENFRNDKM